MKIRRIWDWGKSWKTRERADDWNSMWNLIQTLEIFYWCPGIYRWHRKIDSSHPLIHKWITAFSTKQIFKGFSHSPSRFKQSLFLSVHEQKKDFSFSKHCFPRKLIYQEIDFGYPPIHRIIRFIALFRGKILIVSCYI